MDDRRLILLVEINDVLYDSKNSNFKNVELKTGIWNEIGQRLGCSGETAQRRWKNIKDAFLYSQRRMYSSPDKPGKRYKFADMLSFLKPHLTPKHQEISATLQLHEDIINNADQILVGESYNNNEDVTFLQETKLVSRKRRQENAELDSSRLSSPHQKESVLPKQPDDIDNFFNAMAMMVKALPQKKRAEIKFEVHQLIHKAEMEYLQQ